MVGVEALDIDGAASRALPTGRVIVWKKQRNKTFETSNIATCWGFDSIILRCIFLGTTENK